MISKLDHVTSNILFKNLSDPSFKEYYSLDEINREIGDYEGAIIEVKLSNGKTPRFHMRYIDYLYSLQCTVRDQNVEGISARTVEFIKLATV